MLLTTYSTGSKSVSAPGVASINSVTVGGFSAAYTLIRGVGIELAVTPAANAVIVINYANIDPPSVGSPEFFISRSTGVPRKSSNGLSVVIPTHTQVFGGASSDVPETTLTPPLPSRIVATLTSNVAAYPNAFQQMTLLSVYVTNTSGAAVSGSLTLNGTDEQGIGIIEVLPIASVANAGNSTTISAKYHASLTSIVASGTLVNAGVTITFTEYQIRGYIKAAPGGLVAFQWNNLYLENEMKIATIEVRAAGVFSVQNFMLVGPQPRGGRLSSEPLEWSAGIDAGPAGMLCIYDGDEMNNGHIVIGGNGSLLSEFNGQSWSPAYYLNSKTGATTLTFNDHILAVRNIGRDLSADKDEIVYFGTDLGKFVRWNRTKDTYATVALGGWSTNPVNRFVLGPQTNYTYALGNSGKVNLIQDNGASAPTCYDYSALVGLGTDHVKSGVFLDNTLYVVGGGASGLKLRGYILNSHGFDLSTFLPGTSGQIGGAAGYISGVIARPDGELLLYGFNSASSLYLATWNTRQVFARGVARFTATGAATIPAGFTISDGTRQYKTIAAASSTGATTLFVDVVATTPGIAGCAARSTVTTLVDTATNITAVTNNQAMGMGRFIAQGDGTVGIQQPNGMLSNSPLGATFDGKKYIIVLQGGNVLTYDGTTLRDMTGRIEFKGRATGAMTALATSIIFGDEGKIWSLP